METTIDFSLKDIRVILKHTEYNIKGLESVIKSYNAYGEDLAKLASKLIKELKEELEILYAYRIHLYTKIEKLKSLS